MATDFQKALQSNGKIVIDIYPFFRVVGGLSKMNLPTNDTTMKWKAEIQVIGEEGTWHGNAKEFDVVEDAIAYAKDLFNRWTQTICWRVVSDKQS